MRKETIEVNIAFDGEKFETEAQCLRYERENAWRLLVNLPEAMLIRALDPEDQTDEAKGVAAAIIATAAKLRRVRPNGKAKTGAEPPEPPAEIEDKPTRPATVVPPKKPPAEEAA